MAEKLVVLTKLDGLLLPMPKSGPGWGGAADTEHLSLSSKAVVQVARDRVRSQTGTPIPALQESKTVEVNLG